MDEQNQNNELYPIAVLIEELKDGATGIEVVSGFWVSNLRMQLGQVLRGILPVDCRYLNNESQSQRK